MSEAPIAASETAPPRPPTQARNWFEQLQGRRGARQKDLRARTQDLAEARDYLSIENAVDQALDTLSEKMFGQIAEMLEANLTLALRETLDQNITLKVERDYKRSSATIGFYIERDGKREDIMKGQGGSVANVLSVGLRFFALCTLDPAEHRRFLVLDEQDCWLRPDLVPRLVKIVHDAGRRLGFQTLMISHHDVSAFQRLADKIYKFIPCAEGVRVEQAFVAPGEEAR